MDEGQTLLGTGRTLSEPLGKAAVDHAGRSVDTGADKHVLASACGRLGRAVDVREGVAKDPLKTEETVIAYGSKRRRFAVGEEVDFPTVVQFGERTGRGLELLVGYRGDRLEQGSGVVSCEYVLTRVHGLRSNRPASAGLACKFVVAGGESLRTARQATAYAASRLRVQIGRSWALCSGNVGRSRHKSRPTSVVTARFGRRGAVVTMPRGRQHRARSWR